ncbi:MAG: hypothetical protein LC104_06785 [Bacteroidales bacterium]|nr:hypothetical protein [Bacteroidales bacterium]
MNASQFRAMVTAPPATAGSPLTFWVDDGSGGWRECRFFAWDVAVPKSRDGDKERQTGPAEIRILLQEVPS